MAEPKLWTPKIGAGLWCVGGKGNDSWRQGRDEEVKAVKDRFDIIRESGCEGYSGHVGKDYEFDVDDRLSPISIDRVFEAAGDLVCVDIVGSRFKEPVFREGTFTNRNEVVRDMAKRYLFQAGEAAQQKEVYKVRIWLGSDGKDGHMHQYTPEVMAQLAAPLLEFHDRFPDVKIIIEAKSGEPKGSQVIGTTAQSTSLCQYLNEMVGCEKNEQGRYVNPTYMIGPEINHGLMLNEDIEQVYGEAAFYGVLGEVHAGDGKPGIARDFDDPMGKWTPKTCFETMMTLDRAYSDGIYNADWIILDQNASKVPLEDQPEQLRQSVDFIKASLEVGRTPGYRETVEYLKDRGQFSTLDRFVQKMVGETMVKASDMHPVQLYVR